MTRDEAADYLRSKNPSVPFSVISMYADAYAQYAEATSNIKEFGIVVTHPRTGAPISNPYLVIQDKARATLRKITGVIADGLWQ